MPATPEHERVDVPEPPVTDVELKEQERFVESVVTPSVTVAVNPLTGVTVIVDVALPVVVMEDGLADKLKSGGGGAETVTV